jgi:Holliday junction resolvasome RuvABC endonuclease subunit
MKTIIGIDPGKSGGIAWHDGEQMRVEKMPETLREVWDLIDMIRYHEFAIPRLPGEHGVKAYIEQVHSSPQMGVKSAFTFGQGFGHLEMALTAAGIPFERVRPQSWQKAMQCLTKGDKNVSKRRAQELFPHLKITHATADATLICEYGRRQNQ